mgnify:CR=1 FL=1
MKVAFQTDVGQQRQNNQDYVGFYTNKSGAQFAIVADGMGGHLGGDVASEMAVSHIGYEFERTDDTNIGDSRVYRFRNNELRQLTEDHSLVNELVKQGELTEEAAKHHPQKNIITRTLGVSQDVDADVTIYEFEPDDYLLLCTDGLTNMVDDEQIKTTLMTPTSLEEKCAALIQQANDAGGLDNITALILHQTGEEGAR